MVKHLIPSSGIFYVSWWAALALVLFSSETAAASTFFTHGSEVKSAAGAGTTISRNAPAIFYNPSNLILSNGLEPYLEVSALSLDYRYKYPGYDEVKIERLAPIPILGLTQKLDEHWAIGAFFLPIPKAATAAEINNLPTREVSEEPVLVDVKTRGKNFGYVAGIGFAYRPLSNLTFGASYRQSKESIKIDAKDSESRITLYQVEQETIVNTTTLGTRATFFKHSLVVGLSYKPPAPVTQAQRERIGKDAVWEHNNGSTKEYSFLSLGLEYNFRSVHITPFFELTHEDHEIARDNPRGELDTYRVNNYVVGTKYNFSPDQILTLAYGRFPSHQGNGLMRERSTNDTELIGLRFGDIDGINRSVVSGGYQYRRPLQKYNLGAAYHHGKQSVSEDARGYGEYSLKVFYLTTSVAHSF